MAYRIFSCCLAAFLFPTWSLSTSRDTQPDFEGYVTRFQRAYTAGSEEFLQRKELFHARWKEIQQQNRNAGRLWTAGVNHLTDKTDGELSALRNRKGYLSARASMPMTVAQSKVSVDSKRRLRSGKQQSLETEPEFGCPAYDLSAENISMWQKQNESGDVPTSFSWIGRVPTLNMIRDQGGCGSCWAVTSSTVLWSHAELHGHNRTFSTQELVDCVPNPEECGGTGGCMGATVELAYDWVMRYGIASVEKMPYHGMEMGSQCIGSAISDANVLASAGMHALQDAQMELHSSRKVNMQAFAKLPANRYWPLLYALVNEGPVAVSVAAGPWAMYQSGIFDGCAADAEVDHAVVLVAYGTETFAQGVRKYWTIQNSWSDTWGEEGRIRLLRTDIDDLKQGGHCGTDYHPEVGLGCKGGSPTACVCGMCGVLFDSVYPVLS
mmetsp:Transcript_44473/g.102636  ORF Transcript_44473/g.102636 Transcript_44473/m.102636 type:complete len:437 (-) Transcript_44473:53-1363(-)